MERAEDDDGIRTVESLRGRLLAERVASRTAKEEAELMTKRLMELERLLSMEIRCKNKAEKRLKCALKKLESLRSMDGGRTLSTSSEDFYGGRRLEMSSPTCSSGSLMQEEETSGGAPPHLGDPKERKEDGFATSLQGGLSSESESWSSLGTGHSVNGGANSATAAAASFGGSNHPKGSFGSEELGATADDTTRQSTGSSIECGDHASFDDNVKDDSLALVPANIWGDFGKEEETSVEKRDSLSVHPDNDSHRGIQVGRSNVEDVLLALQRAREHLQNSTYHSAILSRRSSTMVHHPW